MEIADTNGPDAFGFVEFFKGFPGTGVGFLPIIAERGRIGPVDQKQIQVFQIQLFHRTLERRKGFLIPMLAVGQFGCNKEIFPLDPAFLDGLAHAFLVTIPLSRIDMPKSGGNSGLYRRYGNFSVWRLPCSKTNTGNFYPVRKLIIFQQGFHDVSPWE